MLARENEQQLFSGQAYMRVLHILDHSLPLHSGYVFRTQSILREQRALGWDTVQMTTPKQGLAVESNETIGGWKFHRTSCPPTAGLVKQMCYTARRLAALVDETRPDILHAHSPVLNALPALWVARRCGLPLVYEMRASWEDAAVDHGTTTEGSARYRLSRGMETFVLKRAEQITTICEGLRQDIETRGIPGDKVTVIPNAVDVAAFAYGAAVDHDLVKKLGLEGATVLGFAGSFYGYEGLQLLIEAAPRLIATHPSLKILLVGGGPRESALREQVDALGLTEKVIFTGRVPHERVKDYYDLIDILVYPRLPIRLTELVTPLKPLEAMAQGRMLVASDVGGHRELIRHAETGFLFRAGDVEALAAAIDSVLNGREEWPRIREQARRFVEVERTWSNSVSRYADVYRRALASGRRQTASV